MKIYVSNIFFNIFYVFISFFQENFVTQENLLLHPQNITRSSTPTYAPAEPYEDMISTLFSLPEFNWADFPLSPVNVNEEDVNIIDLTTDNDKINNDIIDLTNLTDDDEMIDIENYVFEEGEIWNPTVKKI